MLVRNDNYRSTRNCYYNQNSVNYIIIHYTGCYAPAINFCLNQRNHDLDASAHDFVDENSWYNAISHSHGAYHVGGGISYGVTNFNSIGIEMCCTDENLNVSDKVINNTAEITAYYMKLYGISINNVLRHYDCNSIRKPCPRDMSPIVTGGQEKWNSFKNLVLQYYNGNINNKNENNDEKLIGGIYKMSGSINMRAQYEVNGCKVWTRWYNMDKETCDPYKNITGIEIYTELPLKWGVCMNQKYINIEGSGIIEGFPIFAFQAYLTDKSKRTYYWVSSPGDTQGYEWWCNNCKTENVPAVCENSKGTTPLNAIKLRTGN